MKSQMIAKTCSALISCVLVSPLLQHHDVSRTHMTRQEYLAKDAAHYDKQVAKPARYAASPVASLIFCGALFGAYELVGFGISKVAGKGDVQGDELTGQE
jgi:hypothetical protein